MKLQTGRVLCYAVGGGIIAGVATLTVNPSTTSTSFLALQWASTAMLMWMGLSMAGLVPSAALPAGLTRLPALADRVLERVRHYPGIAPFAFGITWGMTPCPMVYAALFTAALTGSTESGVTWMTGFGLGTIPAVVAAALGISTLSQLRTSNLAQTAAGLAIAAFAGLTVVDPGPAIALLCGGR